MTCPNCRCRFRALEDEEGQHDCPRCGFGPGDPWPPRDEDEDQDEDEATP